MPSMPAGAIDCDIHPAASLAALLPYLEPHWREAVVARGIGELDLITYPQGARITARPDWGPATGAPGATLAQVQTQCLDAFATSRAILTPLYGVQALFSEDLAAAFARAVNDWIAAEWLDRDARLAASIVVPTQSAELAVAEIERHAADPRFVQVLMLAGSDQPLGRRVHWPIYAAAERHGLAIGIHAGHTYRAAPTAAGWPSTLTEDTAAQAQSFQAQVTSLIAEGVFTRFPRLTVVLLESGWTWLPAHLWRLEKYWRGLRMEVPWVDRPPAEIVRDHVRLSITPTDAPADAVAVARLCEHLKSDAMLLFATDWPHWSFEAEEGPLPAGIDPALARKIMIDNPRATYPRLNARPGASPAGHTVEPAR